MELPGSYSNHVALLQSLCELDERLHACGSRSSTDPEPRTSRGAKKHLKPEEVAEIVAKYEAGASMTQLMVEHQMAKRTVARTLREAGVAIRAAGGQRGRQPRSPEGDGTTTSNGYTA